MKRTEPQMIGAILEEFFKRPYVAAKIAEGKLPDTWRTVVGERVAARTTSLRYENRVLYAYIDSSVLRHELFLQRDTLRDALNAAAGMPLINVLIIK